MATGGNATSASARSTSRPASQNSASPMSTVQPALNSHDGTTAATGTMACASGGG